MNRSVAEFSKLFSRCIPTGKEPAQNSEYNAVGCVEQISDSTGQRVGYLRLGIIWWPDIRGNHGSRWSEISILFLHLHILVKNAEKLAEMRVCPVTSRAFPFGNNSLDRLRGCLQICHWGEFGPSKVLTCRLRFAATDEDSLLTVLLDQIREPILYSPIEITNRGKILLLRDNSRPSFLLRKGTNSFPPRHAFDSHPIRSLKIQKLS